MQNKHEIFSSKFGIPTYREGDGGPTIGSNSQLFPKIESKGSPLPMITQSFQFSPSNLDLSWKWASQFCSLWGENQGKEDQGGRRRNRQQFSLGLVANNTATTPLPPNIMWQMDVKYLLTPQWYFLEFFAKKKKLQDAEPQNDCGGQEICLEGSQNQHSLQGEDRKGLKVAPENSPEIDDYLWDTFQWFEITKKFFLRAPDIVCYS